MDKSFWNNKKILITGGTGFLGNHLVKNLSSTKATILVPKSERFDLRKREVCKQVVKGQDIVIHLAAKVGGIGFNLEHPGEMFFDNIMMGAQLMEEARRAGVKKFVALGTICAYPKFTPVPFKEKDLWMGYPEETNAPYGLAKKMLLVQSQAYRQQYNFNSIFLLPVNLYGPGDNFDPSSSHVIPALIKKIYEAKKNNQKKVVVWGTGRPTREFFYVCDAVQAIILATEKYDKSDPINIGAGFEISIKQLVSLICELMNYKGKIIWDKTKPDGQPRRMLDTEQARKAFGFKATTNFETGLKMTIKWYENYSTKRETK
jgi:GDP-L-fucose synthase